MHQENIQTCIKGFRLLAENVIKWIPAWKCHKPLFQQYFVQPIIFIFRNSYSKIILCLFYEFCSWQCVIFGRCHNLIRLNWGLNEAHLRTHVLLVTVKSDGHGVHRICYPKPKNPDQYFKVCVNLALIHINSIFILWLRKDFQDTFVKCIRDHWRI